MVAGGERHGGFGHGGIGGPAAGVGDGHAAADDVDAVDFEVEGAALDGVGDAEGDVVVAGGGDVDGVGEPFAGVGLADVVSPRPVSVVAWMSTPVLR